MTGYWNVELITEAEYWEAVKAAKRELTGRRAGEHETNDTGMTQQMTQRKAGRFNPLI